MHGTKERPAGLPTAGGPVYLVIGKIRRPHGVHGEVVAEISTDFPEGISPNRVVYLGKKHKKLIITNQRPHNEGLLLGFKDVTTPELAGQYRNQILYIAKSEASKLPEGEFYYHELLDLKVVEVTGNQLGVLTEILETGANDVYVVTDSTGRELLIPAIPDVILNVNLDAKIMKVRLLPGLIAEEEESK
jgi:16S rRNA processing protein RimM